MINTVEALRPLDRRETARNNIAVPTGVNIPPPHTLQHAKTPRARSGLCA